MCIYIWIGMYGWTHILFIYTCCIHNVTCNWMLCATCLTQLHEFAVTCVTCDWILIANNSCKTHHFSKWRYIIRGSTNNEWAQRMHSSCAWTCIIPKLCEKHSHYKHHYHSMQNNMIITTKFGNIIFYQASFCLQAPSWVFSPTKRLVVVVM
jgi:hypothetical protein